MNEQKYKDDIRDIKDIMDRSTRLISLSGWSGVTAGIIALIAVYLAYGLFENFGLHLINTDDQLVYESHNGFGLTGENKMALVLLALSALIISVSSGIFFTIRATRRNNQKIWGFQTKRLLINLIIPLWAGGCLCLILLYKGNLVYLASLTLIFYGLGLVHASQYTLKEIRSLGFIEIFLGLLAACWTGYGLIFWALGFGVLHIIYGIFMQLKYKQ